MTSGNQVTVWRAKNYAFDRNVTQDLIGGLNIGFPGQYYDVESDLWSNGYRDYDPIGGRYLQSDPLGLDAGVNTYAYVEGDPANFADPLGLSKGGKRNLSTEGFNKRSNPKEVEEALKDAMRAGDKQRAANLRALLKVIKRGGSMMLPMTSVVAGLLREQCLGGDQFACDTLCKVSPDECEEEQECPVI